MHITINLILLTMIIGYIILMIFINTDVNLMSTCLVSRFAWQGWVTKFKLLQDSMLTPWHTIRTVVNWLCIWFIGLVDDWIIFVHLKSRLWNAFVKKYTCENAWVKIFFQINFLVSFRVVKNVKLFHNCCVMRISCAWLQPCTRFYTLLFPTLRVGVVRFLL